MFPLCYVGGLFWRCQHYSSGRSDGVHIAGPVAWSYRRAGCRVTSTMERMGRVTGSWLSGPQINGGDDVESRGADLGLPQSGPGSLATGWTRVLGLLIDWVLAYGLSLLFTSLTSPYLGTIVLGVWFVIGVVAVSVFGFTPGQFVVGMRVLRVDLGTDRATAEVTGKTAPAAVGIVRAVARQGLIVFLVPALINDYNGRALHDRATGTALIRTR